MKDKDDKYMVIWQTCQVRENTERNVDIGAKGAFMEVRRVKVPVQ
jgi:hypothetical protein